MQAPKSRQLLLEAFENARPKHNLTLSEWADIYRQLPTSANEGGKWRTSKVPYLREPMDCVSDIPTREIVFMASSQVSKTEGLINNAIGYYMHADPSPIMMIQPTLDLAEAWSKTRLAPMIEDTTVLSKLVESPRTRDSGNTVLHKTFPGGYIAIAGANAPTSLASTPVRILALDEPDRYPFVVGKEGDPVSLAVKRTTTFRETKKIIKTSTPTIAGRSRIEISYLASDQRKYWVPCPNCGEFQILKWRDGDNDDDEGNQVFYRIKWDGDPTKAWFVCVQGCRIEHETKRWMLENGEWRAEKPFLGIAGFWINELYSPWVTWGDMVVNFLEAKKTPETLQVFVNTSLAETWKEKGEGVNINDVTSRREKYEFQVPDGVLYLTFGCDVQGDRLEVEVVGWGVDGESWSIEYKVFFGDPGKPDVWADLKEYLRSTFYGRDDEEFNIDAGCVDSGGHHSEAVFTFCKANEGRWWFAIKGASTAGKPIVSRRPTIQGRAKARMFLVGTEAAKDEIMSRLRLQSPGPGYCHFPQEYDDEYFAQLTAEKAFTRVDRKGFKVREYRKFRRNEALDCRVYSRAALAILNPNWKAIKTKIDKAKARAQAETIESKSLPEKVETFIEAMKEVVDGCSDGLATKEDQIAAATEPIEEIKQPKKKSRFKRTRRGFGTSW